MGGVSSASRLGGETLPQEKAENLIKAFVGEKAFPLASSYWQRLFKFPLDLRWPPDRVVEACHQLAINNNKTRHLAKSLIHLSWCFQDCVSASDMTHPAFSKALNALLLLSVFLKYLIENAVNDNFEELHLSLDETEPMPNSFSKGESIENLIIHNVLKFIGKIDVSPKTYVLHHELLNFLLIAMSTQLCSGASPGLNDAHPFTDAAMIQERLLVDSVVHKLLLNYITRNMVPLNSLLYAVLYERNQDSVLRKVGSAAANLMLLPFSYLISSTGGASTSPLAESSLNVLLVLVHYHKYSPVHFLKHRNHNSSSDSLPMEGAYSENPFYKAMQHVQDIEFNRIDIKGNTQTGSLLRLPFASLFDTLGMFLADETSILLLYSLVHGNSYFLEYVLVRTDLDTLLMPMLETLYNVAKRTANHIYMVLIILLILSQDSSFNASIHKLILQNVPWYQECLLHQTSLGSLMIIVLVKTVKYSLSKPCDVYLFMNCLATLANMAPHVHRLSAYASQQLVSLFDMLSRKYNKLAESTNYKTAMEDEELRGDYFPEEPSSELHIYADFLRLVLEILNVILTYALPRNPEVVYAIMHRPEIFLPFKNHPRFSELLNNIYTVLNFFNSRMDAREMNHEWSVEKVLQGITNDCQFWRGEGMMLFAPLHFTYEQESHPEEFFIPYVWQLIMFRSGFMFNPSSDMDEELEVDVLHNQV